LDRSYPGRWHGVPNPHNVPCRPDGAPSPYDLSRPDVPCRPDGAPPPPDDPSRPDGAPPPPDDPSRSDVLCRPDGAPPPDVPSRPDVPNQASMSEAPGWLHGSSQPPSIVPDQLDFPAINEAYRGRAYCYVWGWTARNYSRIALVKKNLCTGYYFRFITQYLFKIPNLCTST
jgi:hypothetical protein